jgi:antirestriction protein ArdC
MHTQELQHEALSRARHGLSMSNYAPIIEGFARMGIPVSEILPRENVFTYNAWRALGRQVRKGEHGVKCLTFIACESKERDAKTGERKSYRRPWSTTVFHVSQTDKVQS